MSTGSAAARRRPLPALALGRVLHLDPASRELAAEVVGLCVVARGPCGLAFVEPALLLGVGGRLAVTSDEREHTEDAVDLIEQMLQCALGLRADRSLVEHAIDVAQPGEDDA